MQGLYKIAKNNAFSSRKSNLYIFIVTLLLAIAYSPIAQCSEIKIDDMGITFTIPSEFYEVPKSEWYKLFMETQREMFNSYLKFDYLFKKGKSTLLFEDSHIFVLIKRSRAITDEEFKSWIDKYYYDFEGVVNKRKKEGRTPKYLNIKLLEPPSIDFKKKYVYTKMWTTFYGAGFIQYSYFGYFPSGALSIVFNAYTDDEEILFKKIIKSIYVN